VDEREPDEKKMEQSFESLAKVKHNLMEERDRIRSQIQTIDDEFGVAGVDRGTIDLWVNEVQPDILLKMEVLGTRAARFERTRAPLDRLIAAFDENAPARHFAKTLTQFSKLVGAIAPSHAFVSSNDTTHRLLRVFWTDPVRLMGVCLGDTKGKRTETFETGEDRAQDIAEWLARCAREATRVDHTLEYFVTAVEHAAPEQLADAVSVECALMFAAPGLTGRQSPDSAGARSAPA
jgi:hypothetical protein